MTVVMIAKRLSLISPRPLCELLAELSRVDRDGESLTEAYSGCLREAGRHLSTASTEARQGWTCRGYENMTSTTIAALPIVDATEGMSEIRQSWNCGRR